MPRVERVPMLWLRWSWRDLRAHWVQVAAIALIIALGTGTYAGLASTAEWRRTSADASYALTAGHDVKVSLPAGSAVPAGTLVGALTALPDPSMVASARERLVVPVQVDASTPGRAILVPGRIVGMEFGSAAPAVDVPVVRSGRNLTPDDAGAPVVVLEHNFAEYYHLPATGTLRLGGGETLTWVGSAYEPEYFVVTTDRGGVHAESRFAVLFTSLETARDLAGAAGGVNDMVIRLREGVDRSDAVATVEAVLGGEAATAGAVASPVDDERAYRAIYEDIATDQQFFNVFAALIFLGAVFAAFNLTTRMVEAQRREIGVAMSLGVARWRIARRPLMACAQISLLGVVFGVGVGIGLSYVMRVILAGFLPLPVWRTPFEFGYFAGVAAVGLAVPVLGVAWPVWRAVRVVPVDAITTGHLVARGNRLTRMVQGLRLPGNSFAQLPFRNLVRAPRRALLTILGVAAVVMLLIAVAGTLDSFLTTINRGEQEAVGSHPDLLIVDLNSVYPQSVPQVQEVLTSPVLVDAEPALTLGGALVGPDEDIDVSLTFRKLDSPLFDRDLLEGSLDSPTPGIVISHKAARDLSVHAGDSVTVRHPERVGLTGYRMVESELPVIGIHRLPFRFLAYLDSPTAAIAGLAGTANTVYADPAAGLGIDGVTRRLFTLDGVASLDRASSSAELARDLISQILRILRVVEAIVLAMALLIAFNSSSINMDERARENATSFAFGVRRRTVLRMAVVESLTIGVLAALVGLGGGVLLLWWLIATLVPRVAPHLSVSMTVAPASLGLVLGVAAAAVALAPLLNAHRLRKMDIPATLRVVE